MPLARRIATLLTAAALATGAAGAAAAQGAIPLPPARPPALSGDPAPPRPEARPPSAAAEPARPADDFTPVTLPPASRARMHECGVEWRRKKMAEETGGMLWRDFARVCLTR
jgi:hypothetical protein